ncbi:MAG: cupin domain-containing protein [Verrucomicrobiae bacterium]|nr:cupin domain-containing protein [Verrucomicrobiae bacterium]
MTTLLPASQTSEIEEQIQAQLNSFGVRLRELRLKRGWTLEELACRSGLSKAFLSRLESGGRQASIAAALTLAGIFHVSLASLFESPPAMEPCVVVRCADAVEKSVNGLKYATLSNAERFFNLQPIKVTVPVSRRGNEHFHHDGEEWIYLLSGALTLSLAGKTYELAPGDAAHFDSRLPHRLIARGKTDAQVVLVASPVASSGQVMLPSVSQHRAIPVIRLLDVKPQTETGGPPKPRQTKLNIKTTEPKRNP